MAGSATDGSRSGNRADRFSDSATVSTSPTSHRLERFADHDDPGARCEHQGATEKSANCCVRNRPDEGASHVGVPSAVSCRLPTTARTRYRDLSPWTAHPRSHVEVKALLVEASPRASEKDRAGLWGRSTRDALGRRRNRCARLDCAAGRLASGSVGSWNERFAHIVVGCSRSLATAR